jgi:tetraacyldisaccharide 4'-kinase
MRTIPWPLAPIKYISSLVFEAIIRMRGYLYSASLIPQHRLPGPVISVGNLTAGGSGKTPLVIYVARRLIDLDLNPVILSRGYARRHPNKAWILPPGKSVPSPAEILGDEPALMRRHLASVWMGISKNRFKAGTQIAGKQSRPVFILDDGFQHRKLHRDLDLVVIDRSQPLSPNRLLPRGTLREPVSGLNRCHAVVINGVPATEKPDPLEKEIRSFQEDVLIFFCKQTVGTLIQFPAWLRNQGYSDQAESPRSAYLVSALGNPDRFHQDIRRLGIDVRGTRAFADHYWLKRKDWILCTEEARNKKVDAIITTEKDAVKISQPPDFPLLVSVQSTELSDASAFDLALKNCAEGYS